jgi:hypothetical protein
VFHTNHLTVLADGFVEAVCVIVPTGTVRCIHQLYGLNLRKVRSGYIFVDLERGTTSAAASSKPSQLSLKEPSSIVGMRLLQEVSGRQRNENRQGSRDSERAIIDLNINASRDCIAYCAFSCGSQ